MLSNILEIIKQNPMVATMYSGGFVALIVMHSRALLSWITTTLLNIVSFDISYYTREVYYNDDSVDKLDLFLKNQTHLIQNSLELTPSNQYKEGYGTSWYIIFGKLVKVYKESKEINGSSANRIYINMRIFFANKKKFLKKLQKEVSSVTEIYENKITIEYGFNSVKREKRPLESVYINAGKGFEMLEDIKHFLTSKSEYNANNILYKRNYLIYGKPGTGKSSLIFAIASELNFKLKLINLKEIFTIDNLLYQIHNSDKTFFVFEDIDAISKSIKARDDEPQSENVVEQRGNFPKDAVVDDGKVGDNSLSLSEILNVLDGLYTSEGAICIFTTNHIEKLDEAFLRDGRMDYKLELGDLDNKTANQMIKDKLGYNNVFKKEFINPATLQELIIQMKWNTISKKDFIEKINR